MLQKILVYSFSTGLQRALSCLATIILAKSFEMEAVGEYVLMQTLAQILIPVFTLNVTVALSREANANACNAIKLLGAVWAVATLICGLAMLVFIISKQAHWSVLGIAFGATEAILACSNAFFLGRECSKTVVAIAVSKSFVFGCILLLTVSRGIGIKNMMALLVTTNYVLAFLFAYKAIKVVQNRFSKNSEKVLPQRMLVYSLATLPHTVALWASASADRLILGMLLGKGAVAQYMIVFTIAQSVMVFISGIVSAVPPRISNDPETWRQTQHLVLFLNKVVKVGSTIIFANILFIWLDRRFFGFLPKMPDHAFLLVGIIGVGFICSVLYVVFASYMYLSRETQALAVSSLVLGPMNFVLMYAAISFGGIVGASVGLVSTYLSFAAFYGYAAARTEKVIADARNQIIGTFGKLILGVICFCLIVEKIRL
jgi:O-antigen/teichoic acid export membrane protein